MRVSLLLIQTLPLLLLLVSLTIIPNDATPPPSLKPDFDPFATFDLSTTIPSLSSLPPSSQSFYITCLKYTSTIVCNHIHQTALTSQTDPTILYKSYFSHPSLQSHTRTCAWPLHYSQVHPLSTLQSSTPPQSPFNVAYPDQNSIYHATLLHIRSGEGYNVEASLGYVRYMSLQTYNFEAVPLGSLRDFNVRVGVGSGGDGETTTTTNAFHDVDGAVNGNQQGRFSVRIVGSHETDGKTNTLPALNKGRRSGFFFLFLRLYDPENVPGFDHDLDANATIISDDDGDCYQPSSITTHNPKLTSDQIVKASKAWGWVCPPKIKHLQLNNNKIESSTLPFCGFHREKDEPYRFNQVAAPERFCLLRENSKDNLFLPADDKMVGLFGNYDAGYLIGCVEQVDDCDDGEMHTINGEVVVANETTIEHNPTPNPNPHHHKNRRNLWARMKGTLPSTSHSLYKPPYISNITSYDVRYVSISSANRSPPGMVYKTLKDRDLYDHYFRAHKLDVIIGSGSGSGDGDGNEEDDDEWSWDRKYEIWFGPNESLLPKEAKLNNAIFMPWPREIIITPAEEADEESLVTYGSLVPYPAILYREILSEGQTVGSEARYHEGVSDIVDDECRNPDQVKYNRDSSEVEEEYQEEEEEEGSESEESRRNLRPYCFVEMCCGDHPPQCCRTRRHISGVMREKYPRVDYFRIIETES